MSIILITGASGFLGGRVAKHFALPNLNNTVVATSRRKNRKDELEAHNCTFVSGDLTDKTFCNTITENIDIIIHCAALSSPFGTYDNFYQSNFIATQNLLESSLKNGVKKFIFISTPSIYFDYTDRFDVKESEPLPNPLVNHYATTKLMAEEIILKANGNNIQTIALRPRAIIGAEDTVIFPRILEAYNKGKLKIVGDGNNICDFTCAKNVIHAIECAIQAHINAYGEAYNITDENPTSFWQSLNYALKELNLKPPTKRVPLPIALFAATISEFIANNFQNGKEPPLTKYGIGILAKSMTLDITKAKTQLGYKPIMTSIEGINEYITWYKKQK